MLPSCCDPEKLRAALKSYGTLRPNLLTIKARNGESGANEPLELDRPMLVIPVTPNAGVLMAYPSEVNVKGLSSTAAEQVFLTAPGGASLYLPAGRWAITQNGSADINALLFDASDPRFAERYDCGDGAFTEPSNVAATANTTTGALLNANRHTSYRLMQNIGSSDVFIKLGAAAVLDEGIYIAPGGHYEMTKKAGNLFKGTINAIARGAASTVLTVDGGVPAIT